MLDRSACAPVFPSCKSVIVWDDHEPTTLFRLALHPMSTSTYIQQPFVPHLTCYRLHRFSSPRPANGLASPQNNHYYKQATALDSGLARRTRGADRTRSSHSPSSSSFSSSSSRPICRARSDVRGRRSGLYSGGGAGGAGGASGSPSTGNTNSITADGANGGGPGGVGSAVAGQVKAEAAGVGTGGGAGVGGGAGGRGSYLAGRSRPAMALGQATQEQQEKGATAGAAAAGETAGPAAAGAAVGANAVITTNRTERGQRLRAVNWVKQVCAWCGGWRWLLHAAWAE